MKIIWLGAIGLMFTTMVVDAANAQVRPDRTLGSESSRVRVDRIPGRDGVTRDSDVIEGGARRGNNLFHSFRQFDVPAGRGAYFSDPNGVSRIFSRVTGHDRSEINGTLGVLGNADLYFINPNGILFGPHASLDLTGSFTATTASAIRFGEESFSATNPETPSRLLRVDPSAFFFNQLSSGNIVSRAAGDSGLQVENGETLTLLGGDVAIRGGRLNAWGGRVEVGAVAGEGTVELAEEGRLLFPDEVSRADVLLNDTLVDVSLDDAGDIDIVGDRIGIENNSIINAGIAVDIGTPDSQAGDIRLDGNVVRVRQASQVQNVVLGIGNAGNVEVKAGSLLLARRGRIVVNTVGQGDAGNVVINADQVRLDGTTLDGQSSAGSSSAISSSVEENGQGQGGDIKITADTLSLTNGAGLTASTRGIGDAGDIMIRAEAVSFDGADTGVTSRVGDVRVQTARGQGGNVEITTNSLSVTNGARLSTSTYNIGDAGNIIIHARGQVLFENSYAASNIEENGRGHGGNVEISTNSLSVTNGARLSANDNGVGDAGNVIIHADGQVLFQGRSADNSQGSGISTGVGSKGRGQGGDIQITADSLSVTDGAQLIAYTVGQGDAGNVIIHADDQVLFQGERDGRGSGASTGVIFGANGNAGNIEITTNSLSVIDGASLSTSTFGEGNAGNIIIHADDQVSFSGTNADGSLRSGAFSNVQRKAFGDGGNIEIYTDFLSVTDHAGLSTGTYYTGDAGNIIIHADGQVFLQGGIISTGVAEYRIGSGGNIEITADSLFLTEGTKLSSDNFGANGAGDIVIQVNNLVSLDQSELLGRTGQTAINGGGNNIRITARGVRLLNNSRIRTDDSRPLSIGGGGGNIRVDANYVLATDGSDILAFSDRGTGGNIDLPSFFSEGDAVVDEQNRLNRNQQNQLDQNDRIDINASGAVSPGIVGLVTPDTSAIQNSLADLSDTTIDPDTLLANSCIARNREGGTFLITGTGGLLTDRPDAIPLSTYPTDTVRTEPDDSNWQPGDPIVEPQGVYQLPNGELFLSQDCSAQAP